MRTLRIVRSLCAGLALAGTSGAAALADGVAVDVELVLAVDVSASIDADQARLQREGYVAALTDPDLIDRIRSGPLGRIAIAYVEWSDVQATIVDWTVIESKADAENFSARLLAAPVSSGSATSLSGAVDYSLTLLDENRYEGTRRVIDVSSDGRNSAGSPLIFTRQRALDSGVVINGLPIVQRDGNGRPVDPGLQAYYANHVIGGPGSFLVVAEGLDAFPEAVRNKMFIEIADACRDPWTCPAGGVAVFAARCNTQYDKKKRPVARTGLPLIVLCDQVI
ncbi:MAG: DUF1194 domain-containing protein [Alphaproteobacteria bacterium]